MSTGEHFTLAVALMLGANAAADLAWQRKNRVISVMYRIGAFWAFVTAVLAAVSAA